MTEETKKVTRGKLLKRVGIGAAVVWTVPMFVSTSSAWALKGGKRCGELARDKFDINATVQVGACTPCPACQNICTGPSCTCACFVNVGGCCHCAGNVSCGSVATCTSNGQCPAGSKCDYTCCDGGGANGFRCLPNCAPNLANIVTSGPSAGSLH